MSEQEIKDTWKQATFVPANPTEPWTEEREKAISDAWWIKDEEEGGLLRLLSEGD